MDYKLTEDELKIIEKVSDLLWVDYEIEDNTIEVSTLISMIEDLLIEFKNKDEKMKEYEKEVLENYRPISYKENIGYREKDFYEEV